MSTLGTRSLIAARSSNSIYGEDCILRFSKNPGQGPGHELVNGQLRMHGDGG